MLRRHIALSLEETRPNKQLSMYGKKSKINKTHMKITNKCFYQEEPVIASHKEGKEEVQEILESNEGLTCCLIS